MQTVHVMAQQCLEVSELTSQAKQRLQYLEIRLQEVQLKFQRDVQVCHDKLRKLYGMVMEMSSRVGTSHILPRIPEGATGLRTRHSLPASAETLIPSSYR